MIAFLPRSLEFFSQRFRSTVCSYTSMLGFFVALAQIEVGIAYACWSALGTLIVSAAGILWFGETADTFKVVCLAMITAGVVGLNLREGGEH